MATTSTGFWYPDEGTSFNINTIMSTMASSLESKVGPHVIDSGWVDCPLVSGTSQQGASLPQVRRIGKKVYMRWGVSGTGKAANGTTNVCTIPVGFRPTEWKYFMIAGSGITTYARITVRSDGSVGMNTAASVGSYYIFDAAHWFID